MRETHLCQGTRRDGQPCTVRVAAGNTHCFAHAQAWVKERAAGRVRGGQNHAKIVQMQRAARALDADSVPARLMTELREIRRDVASGKTGAAQGRVLVSAVLAEYELYRGSVQEERLEAVERRLAQRGGGLTTTGG